MTGTFTGVSITNLTGAFTGEQATITSTVTNEDAELTVYLSNATVNVITGIASHDAISKPPDLTVTTNASGLELSGVMTNRTNVLTAATASSIESVLTSWVGASTTFSGSYTPSGDVYLTAVGISGGISYTDPVISAGNGDLGISGLTSTHNLKSDGTISLTGLEPTITCNSSSVSADSGTNNFLSTAVVNNEVLSFDSGAALTSYDANVSDINVGFSAWSGAPIFEGKTPTGSITTVGALSGTVAAGIKTAGNASLTGMGLTGTAGFVGTSGTISTSGTPLATVKSAPLSYVKSVDTATSGQVTFSGTVSVEEGTFVTAVAYKTGSGTAATITLGSGNITATGTQTLTYSKAKSASATYTPSGTVAVDSFTPDGSVTVAVTPTGTISGTQTVAAHSHTATFTGTSGNITVS